MSLLVDPLSVATVELQRRQLFRAAMDANRRADKTEVSPPLTADLRRRALASCEVPIHALSLAETSSIDILGYWSASYAPHRPVRWPERRVLLDWSLWCCLVLLAVAHRIIGA